MAHEFETGFMVREPAWHGLGTVVKEAPTSREALKLAGLDWVVESRPIYTKEGIEIPNYFANTRNTDNSVLGVVSGKYRIVQNVEAFDFTDSLIKDKVTYESAGSLRDGKQIWLLAKMPRTQIVEDDVDPYICFTNNHEGKGAVQVCMTPIRVVCNNTLNLALNNAKRKWSTRHTGDISAKLAEAQYTLELANDYMENLAKTADELANTPASTERVAEVLAQMFPIKETDSDRKKKNVSDTIENYTVCLLAPDIRKFAGTAWGAINAMADMVDHVAPARNSKNYKENNWGKIAEGHPMLDQFVSLLTANTNVGK